MLITPASFLVCQVVLGDSPAEGLRWSSLDETDTREMRSTKEALDMLIDEHPGQLEETLQKLKHRVTCD